MGAMASQITSSTIVYYTIYSGEDHRKHQSSESLAFVRGNSPVTGEFVAPMASNMENVSIWWRHHGDFRSCLMWYWTALLTWMIRFKSPTSHKSFYWINNMMKSVIQQKASYKPDVFLLILLIFWFYTQERKHHFIILILIATNCCKSASLFEAIGCRIL